MKAILTVSKTSAYAKYNGLTFEVKEFLNKLVALNIEGRTVDFGYSEVVVVDLQNELNTAFKNADTKDYDSTVLFRNMREYIKANDFKVETEILLK